MPSPSPRQFSAGLWLLGAIVTGLSVTVWAQYRGDSPLSLYSLFPLLGLVAFGLMWTHYIGGALRRYWNLSCTETQPYFTYTSWAVLLLILLHPGLLWTGLFQDGFGLPPGSHLNVYTDTFARIALLHGMISLVVFLAYEFHRKYSSASWWKYIEYLNAVAMVSIFFHALTLGGELGTGWFRVVWALYGVSLIAAIFYSYVTKRKRGEVYEE